MNKDVPGLVGTAGALRLIGRDAFSNLVTVGGATIGVSFRVGGTNVPVVIADYGNGTYDIQYTAGTSFFKLRCACDTVRSCPCVFDKR